MTSVGGMDIADVLLCWAVVFVTALLYFGFLALVFRVWRIVLDPPWWAAAILLALVFAPVLTIGNILTAP